MNETNFKMKLFVIEGLDGAGKSTQIKLLKDFFSDQGYNCEYLHFPRTHAPYFGELIARFLRGEFGSINDVDPYLVAILYAGDRKDASDMVSGWLKEGNIVIIDRYTYSNIAYQCAKVKDIHKRISEFLVLGDESVDIVGDEEDNPFFRIVPLALNMKQIKQYKCPPNPAKITDPRAVGYIEEYGNKSWELDALEPKVLMAIAEEGIKEFIDLEKYYSWIEKERKEKKALEDFGDSLLKKEAKKK